MINLIRLHGRYKGGIPDGQSCPVRRGVPQGEGAAALLESRQGTDVPERNGGRPRPGDGPQASVPGLGKARVFGRCAKRVALLVGEVARDVDVNFDVEVALPVVGFDALLL